MKQFKTSDIVKVRLTVHGIDRHREVYEENFKTWKHATYAPPKVDKEGLSEWRMWDLMVTFGDMFCQGCDRPFEFIVMDDEIITDYQWEEDDIDY